MISKPCARAGVRHRQRFGQSAGLVELDVDGVVAAAQAGERAAVMHALVGADRNRAPDPRQRRVLARGQRLLDQGDAGIGAGSEIGGEVVLRPGLVGVDDQLGSRRRLAHGGDPRAVAFAAELDLEQLTMRGLRGGLRHRL
ncbi:hypothetical protein ACVIM9_003281 [Bradyrhizobium sp. USDA 4520]